MVTISLVVVEGCSLLVGNFSTVEVDCSLVVDPLPVVASSAPPSTVAADVCVEVVSFESLLRWVEEEGLVSVEVDCLVAVG